MKFFKFYRFICYLLLVLFPVTSMASTFTAASCSLLDVTTAYNNAAAGDTVSIPAGSCTWTSTSGLTISKSIILQGAGSASTHITHGVASPTITVSLSSDVPVRITGLHINKVNQNCTGCNAVYLNLNKNTQVRLDHNKFELGLRAVFVAEIGDVGGLIDHNEFVNNDIAVGVMGDDNAAWSRPIEAGTSKALFVEDNTFTINNNTPTEPDHLIYLQEGARTVIRHNVFDSSTYTNGTTYFFDSHGNQNYYNGNSGDFRGQPITEVYGNLFHAYRANEIIGGFRSGSLLIHDNTMLSDLGSPTAIKATEEEGWQVFFSPLRTVWPAEDQVFNSFIWNNTLNGAPVTDLGLAFNSDSIFIQKDRDYFMHAPAATGGQESFTGRAGASNSAPTSGSTSTMIFSSSAPNAYYPYVAYQYPHPLIGQNTSLILDAPKNLRTIN
ncbi:MAG: hypothetical protein ACXVB1_07120 [Pseudobdellovibrionaceae bacterium]